MSATCTCKITVKRDKNLLSSITHVVSPTCTVHVPRVPKGKS